MNQRQPAPLERVRRISRAMRLILGIGIAFVAAGAIALWASDYLLRVALLPHLGLAVDGVTLARGTRLVGFLVGLPTVGMMLAILCESRGLFENYAEGQVFVPGAVHRLRRLALDVIVLACLQPVVRTLLVLVLTLCNPPGRRLLSIDISSNDVVLAALGGLLLAVAWVMVEAARVADDNRGFV